MAGKKEKRFVIKEEQGLSWGSVQVVVDTVTGVNYLFTMGINGTSASRRCWMRRGSPSSTRRAPPLPNNDLF